MIIKVSKELLHVLPVTSASVRKPVCKQSFKGWGQIESIVVYAAESWTSYDLQTFLSILAVFHNEPTFDRDWETSDERVIPVKAASLKWSKFLQYYRHVKRHVAPNIFNSISRVLSTSFDVTYVPNSEHKKKVIRNYSRLIWDCALYYYHEDKFVKVEKLGGNGPSPKHYRIGFTIDKGFWDECQRGFLINIDPILSLSRPTSINLGLWIQGQKYTSLSDRTLFEVLHMNSKAYINRKLLRRAFNDIEEVGIISSWKEEKVWVGEYKYSWEKVDLTSI